MTISYFDSLYDIAGRALVEAQWPSVGTTVMAVGFNRCFSWRDELPDTPLQSWLNDCGACPKWRERVWARTAREVWENEPEDELRCALETLFELPEGNLTFEKVAAHLCLPKHLW